MTTPIHYGYVQGGYSDPGYSVEFLGVSIQLVHAAGTIQFATGFKYPSHGYSFFQSLERTGAGIPIYGAPVMSQIPFAATWPQMTDAELAALRTWMFTTLPLFDRFTLKMVGQDMSIQARLASRTLKCKHVIPGANEVTVNFLRV